MIKLWGGEENAKAQIDSNFHHGHSCPYGFGYEYTTRWFDTRSRRTTCKCSDRVDAHIFFTAKLCTSGLKNAADAMHDVASAM